MTFAHDLHPSDLTSEDNWISYIHVTFKLSILFNHAVHPKGLVLIICYTHYPLL